MCVYADETGYRFWNSKKDPMPFKTRDNAGLKILEETPDYIQYICKNAVMTTAEQYVVGSYDTFMVRMRDIEGSQELMRSYNITWTSQDSINLFHEINNAELERISNTPIMLPENEENQPLILESKTVPVDYDCCFTVRKDDNYSFYINEGYENLWSNTLSANLNTINSKSGTGVETISYINKVNGGIFKLKGTSNTSVPFIFIRPVGINQDDILSSTGYCSFNRIGYKVGTTGGIPSNTLTYVDNIFKITNAKMVNVNFMVTVLKESQSQIGEDYDVEVDFKNFQITKTSTQKPFVKSIQPNCKLAFNTPATSETHSFIMKNINFKNDLDPNSVQKVAVLYSTHDYTQEWIPFNGRDLKNEYYSCFISNIYKSLFNDVYINNSNISINGKGKTTGTLNFTLVTPYTQKPNTFSQLLIYENDERGGMTETELKAELAKDIRLK